MGIFSGYCKLERHLTKLELAEEYMNVELLAISSPTI